VGGEIEAAKQAVEALRTTGKADVVILLAHLDDKVPGASLVTANTLAANVPGIDLIIDGQSLAPFDQARRVGNTWIVSSLPKGESVGYGLVTIVNGKVAADEFAWQPIPVTSAAFPPDPDVDALIQQYVTRLTASEKGQTVMLATEKFADKAARYGESALGDLLADASAWYVRTQLGRSVDFALQNSVIIQNELPAGRVTADQIRSALPRAYHDYVVTLRGSDVRALFEHIAKVPQGSTGFPQVSREVRYTLHIDREKAGTIDRLTIEGKPIESNRLYRIATNDYLASGGDGYDVLKRSVDSYSTNMVLADVVVAYAKTLVDPAAPAVDERIRVIGPGAVNP
jgi:5'-nucleotidase/UDP-sugar diphosphatase